MHALKQLCFSHNAISTIPPDFQFPPSLTFLDLSFNKIDSISLNLPELTNLSLDYNQLTSFDPSSLPVLHFLSLSNNKIATPLSAMLPTFLALPNLRDVEFLNNTYIIPELPPTRCHFLVTEHPLGNRFGIGYSATMGDRPSMEDSVLLRCYLPSDYTPESNEAKIDKEVMAQETYMELYAIFDGHSGNIASSTAAKCLEMEVQKIQNVERAAFSEAFSKCFYDVNEKLRLLSVPDGCTAAAALFRGDIAYIAGVGDSRVVLVTKDGAERLTVDSKPLDRSEFERLKGLGLQVNFEGRIARKLAVSRSLGDFRFGDLFVAPEIYEYNIKQEDVAIIIACDGLWDVVSDEKAAEIVRAVRTGANAAVTLKNYAYAMGSKDNISVIVIMLHPPEEETGLCQINTVEELPVVCEEEAEEQEMNLPIPIGAGRDRRRRR